MVQPAVQTACSRRLLQCAAIFHRVSIKTSARAKRRVSRSLLNGQGVASFGGHGAESRMSLIRSAADSGVCCSSVLQRPQRQLLSQTRLNFSTLKNIFLLTHRSGTESPVWQVALFPLQDVPLRPPSKKRPGLSDRQPARQHRGQRLLSFNICFI